MAAFVTYDYEEPGFWHVYSVDREPQAVNFGCHTLLTIQAPETDEWRARIAAITDAIDAAISAVPHETHAAP